MTALYHDFHASTSLNHAGVVKNLPDTVLLDLVQQTTLKYFSEFAHPVSGMARERSNYSPVYDFSSTVTTGGTGFGIMALIVGASRGWLTRQDVAWHINTIVSFLSQAPTYHGMYPHFMHGNTGTTIPFGPGDDGADIVETSFLMMGLLTARQFLEKDHPLLALRITDLWEAVEWDHQLQHDRKNLIWHWSAAQGFHKNLPVQGWSECLVTQVLAASSPTHGVTPDIYHGSWAKGNDFHNGKKAYGIELPLGPEKGGPLFFTHYSFMGLDPRGLSDQYVDYWEQNLRHVLINRAHCLENPYRFEGYGEKCWGLTASDSYLGYDCHSPTHDSGVISPTAALSSFPYTPDFSMQALRHFYEDRGHQLWRAHGFADAFHPGNGWVDNGHLAIDQGPIVCMIENYRTGLLWNLFMSCPEIQNGLKRLGFKSPHLKPECAMSQGDRLRPEYTCAGVDAAALSSPAIRPASNAGMLSLTRQ